MMSTKFHQGDPPDIRALRSTYRYQQFRARFMRMPENQLCAECKRGGRVRRSKDMDHIVPVREAPERVYDPENLQALCRPCHEWKTSMENRQPDPEGEKWDALIKRLSTPA